MDQKASTVREFTPDTKPSKKENDLSLEKPKNENEDNEINARESSKAIQKRLGVNVLAKDSEMLMETESFIVEAVVIEKLKNSGNFNEISMGNIATAIKQKLECQYGGCWNVIIKKDSNLPDFAYVVGRVLGSHIQLTYESNHYSVFRSK